MPEIVTYALCAAAVIATYVIGTLLVAALFNLFKPRKDRQ